MQGELKMSIELWMLVSTIGLFFGLTVFQSIWNIYHYGLYQIVGPRDELAGPTHFLTGRFQRAIHNLIEGLVVFIPLVLTAHVLGISNIATIIGAQLFFYSRLIHAIVYIAGIPWIRTLAYAGGVAGMVMIVIGIT